MRYRLTTIIALAAILTGCTEKIEPTYPEIGDPVPAFNTKLSTGETVTHADICSGKTLIIFFNTGCPDCRLELPTIQEFSKRNPDIRTIAISREENARSVGRHWETCGYTIPYSAHADRKIFSLFAASLIPRTYVVREGIIKAIYTDKALPTVEMLENDFKQN